MTDETARNQIAEAFERDLDPLEEYSATFESVNADPFNIFRGEILESRGLSDKTLQDHDRIFEQWREHMTEQGRHPACPSEDHVLAFIHNELETNQGGTVKRKLNSLNAAYQYWQADAGFPHPHDYNPFAIAVERASFPDDPDSELPRISIDELRERVSDTTHHRDRAILLLQLKCGLREGEVCNIKIGDVTTQHAELRRHYPEYGSHAMLDGRQNAIFVPDCDERDGNKSGRPRLLPLDDELRRALVRYLLVRPPTDHSWLFISKEGHKKLNNTNAVWESAFGDYDEITSHYGRHWFSTYWTVHEDLNPELVHYMRGDEAGTSVEDGALRHYIHTYYEDIEEIYLDRIFKLKL